METANLSWILDVAHRGSPVARGGGMEQESAMGTREHGTGGLRTEGNVEHGPAKPAPNTTTSYSYLLNLILT